MGVRSPKQGACVLNWQVETGAEVLPPPWHRLTAQQGPPRPKISLRPHHTITGLS